MEVCPGISDDSDEMSFYIEKTMNEYADVVLQDVTTGDAIYGCDEVLFSKRHCFSESNMDKGYDAERHLAMTLGKLQNLKIIVNKLKMELTSCQSQMDTLRADNSYIRTENIRLKNAMKVRETESTANNTAAEISFKNDDYTTMSRELQQLREDCGIFNKFVYQELDLIKMKIGVSGRNTSINTSTSNTNTNNTSDISFQLVDEHRDIQLSPATMFSSASVSSGNQETKAEERCTINPKIVPGTKSYSRAHIAETVVLCDSTIGHTTSKQFNCYLEGKEEKIILKKFPGHTADEIKWYCDHPLKNIKPRQVIVIAGTNDITKGFYEKNLDIDTIINNIIDIGRKGRENGALNVVISSILPRRGYKFVDVIRNINNGLSKACMDEGFEFLDNLDIVLSHIGKDGIHPNNKGHTILKMNLLKCMFTFNPYCCDFTSFYDRCLL